MQIQFAAGKVCELKEVKTRQDYANSYPLLFMLLQDEAPEEAAGLSEDLCYKSWVKSKDQGYLLYQCIYKGRVIAVFGLQKLYDPISIDACFRINNLIVLPDFRGLGLGTKIFHVIEDIAKENEASAVILEVLHTNEKAKKFYNRLDYTCVCERMWKKI